MFNHRYFIYNNVGIYMSKEHNIFNNALLLFLLSVFKSQMFKECITKFLLERNAVQDIMWYSVYAYQNC